MSPPFIREFKLAGPNGDGRHAYANADGAFIGRGVPLLERDSLGRWRPRDNPVLERLFGKGYGVPVELGWRTTQLRYVAQALNKGDLALALISLVRMELPPLPSAERARVMAKADGLLAKDDPHWEDEPRVPAGGPNGGQWTTGGANEAEPLRLPPGQRIDELGDLLEWIANAKPDDERAIRREIKRLYYDVGDTFGGDALNRALSDVIQSGGDRQDREAVLKDYESYTRADPAEAAQHVRDLVAGVLAAPLGAVLEEIPPEISVWKMPPTLRGLAINKRLGANPYWASNTPVVDAFTDDIAISIKLIDLNAATYQDAGRPARRINDYVDKLADFDGMDWDDVIIQPQYIAGKTLKLAIPEGGMTVAQSRAIGMAQKRAAELGVDIELINIW
jgi:hypothetical protein